MIKIISILLISSALAADGEPDCATSSTVVDDSFNKMAIELSRTCNASVYQTSEKMCECLEKNKLIELRVPDEQKKALDEKKIEKSIGKTLKFAIDDLLMNTTKYKNLNLRNELHNAHKESCSPQSIVANIKFLEPGSMHCPGSKEKIEERLKTIFGDVKIDDFPAQYDNFNLNVDSKSCISRHNFLRLRSSNKRSQGVLPAFSHASNESVDDFFTGSSGKDTVANLLTYDLFFSLGYKNPEFKKAMSDLIKSKYDWQKQKKLDEFLYTDHKALNIARIALNESCVNLEEQINYFLCSEKTPELNSRNLSLALDDNKENQEPENFHTKQYFMKRFSCAKTDFVRENSQRFNNFFEAKTLRSRLAKDAVSDKPKSDYSVFNEMFCQGRAGQQLAESELPGMMKDYFAKKLSGKPAVDLKKIFTDPAIVAQLGLEIDPDKSPMIRSLSEGLPEIHPSKWPGVKLMNAGMSFEEVDQLYGIIEMQTTARKAEVTSIQQQLADKNPALKNITVSEVDGLLRQDPSAVASFKTRYPEVQDPVAEATAVYQQQNNLRAERFNIPPVANNSQVNETIEAGGHVAERPDSRPPTTTVNQPDQTDDSTTDTTSKKASPSRESSRQTQLPQSTPGLLITGKTTSGSSAGQSGGTSDQSNSNDRSFSSGTNSNSGTIRRSSAISNDTESDASIRRLEEEMSANRARFEATKRKLDNFGKLDGNSNRVSRSFSNNGSSYQFPRNVPLKSLDGEYSYPETEGSELSSLSNSSPDDSRGSGDAQATTGGSKSSDQIKSDMASASFGSGAGLGGGATASRNRNPANAGSESDLRKILGLAPYEFYKYIPHSIFDVVGSVDKVVLLLGLEGRSFKTIEAIEEYDPKSDKVIIKYIERTFDFVPEGKFSKFKEDFSTEGRRIASFKSNFDYSRNKENIQRSKNYSMATKEVARKEVPHDFVLKIQNYILSDAEIKDTITKAMELLK